MITAEEARKLTGFDVQDVIWKLDNWYPQVGRRIEEAARKGHSYVFFYDIDFDCRLKLAELAKTLEKVLGYRVEFLAEGRTLKVEW